MAKATIAAKSGALITIEGTEEEVAALVMRFEGFEDRSAAAISLSAVRSGRTTPMGLLAELIGRGFFNTPKELGAVKASLEEEGHFYPTTTLSPLMLRLVRRRELRRIKEKKRWFYVR